MKNPCSEKPEIIIVRGGTAKIGGCPANRKIYPKGSYEDCNGFEWYSFNDLKWCPYQIIWLVENYIEMSEGMWPDPPEHLEMDNVQKSKTNRASFVNATLAAGYLAFRFKRCGKEGKALWQEIESYIKNAEKEGKKFEPSNNTKMAWYYITGNNGKGYSFRQWKYDRKNVRK